MPEMKKASVMNSGSRRYVMASRTRVLLSMKCQTLAFPQLSGLGLAWFGKRRNSVARFHPVQEAWSVT